MRGLFYKTLLAIGLAVVGGCSLLPPPALPVKRVFVNLPSLRELHPGAKALAEMDKEIAALEKLAGVDLSIPEISLPAPVALPAPLAAGPGTEEKKTFFHQAQQTGETHLSSLREELAAARALKVEQRRAELLLGLKQEMKVAQAQGREKQGRLEDEIYQRHRRAIFNLQANLQLQGRPGEAKDRLTAELQKEEAAQAAEIAALHQTLQDDLAHLQETKLQEIEKLLDAYEQELAAQDEALVSARQNKMQQELATAAARLTEQSKGEKPTLSQPSAGALAQGIKIQRRQAGAIASDSRRELLNKLTALRQARRQLEQSLEGEMKAALAAIGKEQNLEFIFDPKQRGSLPDYTAQAADWLKQYWQAP